MVREQVSVCVKKRGGVKGRKKGGRKKKVGSLIKKSMRLKKLICKKIEKGENDLKKCVLAGGGGVFWCCRGMYV